MRRTLIAICVLALCVGSAGAVTTVYTTEADFLTAIGAAPYLLEEFNGYTYGSYTELTLDLGPMNGYSCTLSALNGLWSGDGNMSTNNAGDPIDVAFTGAPVFSVGGFFFASDISGFYIPGTVILTLSDGTVETYAPPTDTTFRGFVSDTAIVSMAIDADDALGNSWATMDHFYVGGVDQGGGGGGGGGGGTGGVATPVPTVSTSGMIVLILALVGVALVIIRRRF